MLLDIQSEIKFMAPFECRRKTKFPIVYLKLQLSPN